GIFDWLEARVRGPDAVAVFEQPEAAFGLGDPSAGFKIGGLLAEHVAMSSVWEVSIPIGTDGFSREEAELRADVQLDWRFFGPLTITPNAFAAVRAEIDAPSSALVRYVEAGGSLKLTWQIIDV